MDRPPDSSPDRTSDRSDPKASRLALAVLLVGALVLGVISAREPLLGLVLSVLGVVSLFALRVPDAASYAVLFLLYSNLPAVGVAFHGVPKVLAGAFPLLLSVPLARDLFLKREPPVIGAALPFLLLLLGVQLVGALFALQPEDSFKALVTFLTEGVVLYVLVTNTVRSKAVLRGATWALLLAGLPMSLVPLYQQATRTFQNNYGGLAQVDGLGFKTSEGVEEGGGEVRQARLAGPIGEKNRYSQVMLMLVPLGLMRFWGEKKPLLRWGALACTGLASLGFVLAFSRGGAFGLVCMVGVMVFMRLIDVRKFVFVAAGGVLLLAALPQYWERLATIGSVASLFSEEGSGAAEPDGAVKRRVTEMMAAVRVFVDHPLVGVGPGQFKAYSEEYGNIDALRKIETGRRAHSLFLEIAAENGALGLTAFVCAILVTFVGLFAARRATLVEDPELANLVTGILLALVCYVTTGIFLHLSYMRYFYVVLALGGAAASVGLRAARAARAPEAPVPAAAVSTGGAA